MNTWLVGTGWSQSFAAAIFAVLILSSVAIFIAWWMKVQPVLRHGLLLSALLACLAVPIVSGVTWIAEAPVVSISVIVSGAGATTTEGLSPSAGGAVDAPNGTESPSAEAVESNAIESQAGVSPPLAASPAGVFESNRAVTAVRHWNYESMILALWLSGTCCLAAFSVRGYWLGRQIRRQALPMDLVNISDQVEAAVARVGLPLAPRILCSEKIAGPAVHGFVHPAVILPTHVVNGLPVDQLTDVLIHEFAHVRRRDTRVLVLESLARCLFWPVITVHWLLRDLENAREEICDNYVVLKRDGIHYAETLLGLAEIGRRRRWPGNQMPAVGMMNWRGPLEHRVAGILDERRDRSLCLSRWLFVPLVIAGLGCSVLFSGARLVADDQAGARPSGAFGPIGPQTQALPPTQREVDEAGTRTITVRGTTRDAEGNVVSGASVFLIAHSWQGRIVAEMKSDEQGEFAFEEAAIPIKSGNASVFATAEDHGITWHGMMSLMDQQQLAQLPEEFASRSFDPSNPVEMNLVFSKAATLLGIIHDGDGKPVADATVRIRQLDYLDPSGKPTHVNYREFYALQLAPTRFRVARTDRNGKFQFPSLPLGTYALLGVEHKDYANKSLYAAITDQRMHEFERPSGSASTIRNGKQVSFVTFTTTPVMVNPVLVQLDDTQQVTVRAVDHDSHPLSGMRVYLRSTDIDKQVSAYGMTDDSGAVQLNVPAGEYSLRIRPPRTTDRVEAVSEIEIVAGNDVSRDIIVPLGGQLVTRVIDAETGEPIQGVGFSLRRGPRTYGLTSVPHYVDHPRTDANGELRVLLPAGKHAIGIGSGGLPEGYRHANQMRNIAVESGKVVTETFSLQRR